MTRKGDDFTAFIDPRIIRWLRVQDPSLRVPLLEVTEGPGAVTRWQRRPPARAAGLTDRVWSLREVLMDRVPPWPLPQAGEGCGEVKAREPALGHCVSTPSCGVT
jgi:hypothetical protein